MVQVVCIEDDSEAKEDPPQFLKKRKTPLPPLFVYPAKNASKVKAENLCGDLQRLVPEAWLSSGLIELYSL
jgi:hypothetical protein